MLHALRTSLRVLWRQALAEDDHGRRGLDMGGGDAHRVLHDGKFVVGSLLIKAEIDFRCLSLEKDILRLRCCLQMC